MTYNGALRPSKAPNLPVAPTEYDQRYIDQLSNALRLYFTQIDNFIQAIAVPDSGTTAERPTDNLFVGQQYYDTTLGALLVWNGSAWVSSVPSSSTVSSFSAGTTGFTPSTASTGAVTLAGILAIASGGTGSSTGLGLVPAGVIEMWPTGTAPSGYLLCAGAAVSRTTYATLFGVVGTTFGVGDGSTTFNLPNYTGRMPYGATIGSTGGSADAVVVSHNHTATVTDPGHNHLFGADDMIATQGGYATQSGFSYDATSTGAGGGVNLYTKRIDNTQNGQTTGITVANTAAGVSGTNANLPPYLGINFIIKT